MLPGSFALCLICTTYKRNSAEVTLTDSASSHLTFSAHGHVESAGTPSSREGAVSPPDTCVPCPIISPVSRGLPACLCTAFFLTGSLFRRGNHSCQPSPQHQCPLTCNFTSIFFERPFQQILDLNMYVLYLLIFMHPSVYAMLWLLPLACRETPV